MKMKEKILRSKAGEEESEGRQGTTGQNAHTHKPAPSGALNYSPSASGGPVANNQEGEGPGAVAVAKAGKDEESGPQKVSVTAVGYRHSEIAEVVSGKGVALTLGLPARYPPGIEKSANNRSKERQAQGNQETPALHRAPEASTLPRRPARKGLLQIGAPEARFWPGCAPLSRIVFHVKHYSSSSLPRATPTT